MRCSLIVSDAESWPRIQEDPFRAGEVLGWLAANGIDPRTTCAADPVAIDTDEAGVVLGIRHTAWGGYDRTGIPWSEERTVPLAVDPPAHWALRITGRP